MSYFLIRPGETDYDQQGRVSGRLSLPLSAEGRRQLGETLERLRGIELDAVYTSGAEPALSTAIAIADLVDADVKVLESLANFDLGLWQGLCLNELRQRQPRLFRLWREAPDAVCPPQGETCAEAMLRVQEALRKPLRRGLPFAVVAAEPLASMVGQLLRGAATCSPGPLCGNAQDLRVEEFPAAALAPTRP
jgi:probable phosphoglycerate mutase